LLRVARQLLAEIITMSHEQLTSVEALPALPAAESERVK